VGQFLAMQHPKNSGFTRLVITLKPKIIMQFFDYTAAVTGSHLFPLYRSVSPLFSPRLQPYSGYKILSKKHSTSHLFYYLYDTRSFSTV